MDPYDSWLCGGSLVTTSQILTAAACIVDIDNLYAIAGYRKYVKGLDLDKDNCTKIKKKRITKIRVPREHISHINEYMNTTQWMSLDIGVATVETPYDFNDISFKIHCSYIPASIKINYDPKFDRNVGTNVVALGWGRNRASARGDLVDRNSETLSEVSMKIRDKKFCIDKFEGNGISNLISKYMICTYGKGILDADGLLMEDIDQNKAKCIEEAKLHAKNSVEAGIAMDECDLEYFEILESSPRYRSNFNESEYEKSHKLKLTAHTYELRSTGTRRQGICQNDHGGPLITWVGSAELLIGVAVNSLYDDKFECIGPYLFLSTSTVGQIVRCLLATENPRRTCMVDSTTYYVTETHATTLSDGNAGITVSANVQALVQRHSQGNTYKADTEAPAEAPEAPIAAIAEIPIEAYSKARTMTNGLATTMTNTRKPLVKLKESYSVPRLEPVENIMDLIFRTKESEELASRVHTIKPFKRKSDNLSSIEVISL